VETLCLHYRDLYVIRRRLYAQATKFQQHQLRIAQYFEPTTEDVVELPEPYDLEPPIKPTEAQIEADHTKMTVYMHRLNLHEIREKKVGCLTTFMKQTLDEKNRDRVRDTTMSSLGHGFITPTQYYHAVWKTVRPNDQSQCGRFLSVNVKCSRKRNFLRVAIKKCITSDMSLANDKLIVAARAALNKNELDSFGTSLPVFTSACISFKSSI
jgi:hypothetical protein